MPNVVDYVEEFGQYSFEEKPFCEIDSLVLSLLCYLNFTGLVPEINEESIPVKMSDILDHVVDQRLFFTAFNVTGIKLLFLATISSRRFRNTKLNFYVDITEDQQEIQFAAITFLLDNSTTYISFRGTDSTFVGWKEDFNMTFMDEIPSQTNGLSYLKFVCEKIEGDIIIGGHSKGGNIAVYSAVKYHEQTKYRIKNIYNHDGPGFSKEFLDSKEFKEMEYKVHTTIPRSSIVGMLLQQHEKYRIVGSSSYGMFQHDGFSWIVEDGDFKYADDLNVGALRTHKIINRWLTEISPEKRHTFIDTIYNIVRSTNASTISELRNDWKKNSISIVNHIRGMDSETISFVIQTINLMVSAAIRSSIHITMPKLPKSMGKGGM